MRVNLLNVCMFCWQSRRFPGACAFNGQDSHGSKKVLFLNEGSLINQKTAFLKMTKEIEKITVLFQIKSNPYLLRVHFKD